MHTSPQTDRMLDAEEANGWHNDQQGNLLPAHQFPSAKRCDMNRFARPGLTFPILDILRSN